MFAIYVAALHTPGNALEAVGRHLAPRGLLYLFSQAPGWKKARDAELFAADLSEALETAHFTVEKTLVEDVRSGFVSCVIAQISR